MKVVLDTNTLISATIAKGNEFELLRKAKNNEFKLILSLEILNEFEDVISRKRFGYNREDINKAIDAVISIAEIIEPTERINVIKEDSDDNIILECALSGRVDYIVSGDRHLLDLERYGSTDIVRTRKMLEILE